MSTVAQHYEQHLGAIYVWMAGGAEAVVVHDILQQRTAEGWQTRVSHYRTLRLSPRHLTASLQRRGFSVRREVGMNGIVRLVAQ